MLLGDSMLSIWGARRGFYVAFDVPLAAAAQLFGGRRRASIPRLDSGRGGRHAGGAEEEDGSGGEDELSGELHFFVFYSVVFFV